MSSFREMEQGRKLLEQWKQDIPFSKMVEDTGFRVNKIRSLIAEAAGGANEWRKMREARRGQNPLPTSVPTSSSAVSTDFVRRVSQEAVEGIFDSDTIREMVQDEVKKYPPQTGKLEITLNKSAVKIVIKQSHAALKEALASCRCGLPEHRARRSGP